MAYFVLAGLRSESCQPEVLPSIEVRSKLDLGISLATFIAEARQPIRFVRSKRKMNHGRYHCAFKGSAVVDKRCRVRGSSHLTKETMVS